MREMLHAPAPAASAADARLQQRLDDRAAAKVAAEAAAEADRDANKASWAARQLRDKEVREAKEARDRGKRETGASAAAGPGAEVPDPASAAHPTEQLHDDPFSLFEVFAKELAAGAFFFLAVSAPLLCLGVINPTEKGRGRFSRGVYAPPEGARRPPGVSPLDLLGIPSAWEDSFLAVCGVVCLVSVAALATSSFEVNCPGGVRAILTLHNGGGSAKRDRRTMRKRGKVIQVKK